MALPWRGRVHLLWWVYCQRGPGAVVALELLVAECIMANRRSAAMICLRLTQLFICGLPLFSIRVPPCACSLGPTVLLLPFSLQIGELWRRWHKRHGKQGTLSGGMGALTTAATTTAPQRRRGSLHMRARGTRHTAGVLGQRVRTAGTACSVPAFCALTDDRLHCHLHTPGKHPSTYVCCVAAGVWYTSCVLWVREVMFNVLFGELSSLCMLPCSGSSSTGTHVRCWTTESGFWQQHRPFLQPTSSRAAARQQPWVAARMSLDCG